jgi:uncharacterized membrane protein
MDRLDRLRFDRHHAQQEHEMNGLGEGFRRTLGVVGTTGTGIAGGIFLAFSTMVGTALRRLQVSQAITAMHVINQRAPAPYVIFGMIAGGLPAAVLAVDALVARDVEGSTWRLIGGLLCVASVVITLAYHVPRNDSLDRLPADSLAGATYWAGYIGPWLAWNHVRAVAAIAGAAGLAVGLRASSR